MKRFPAMVGLVALARQSRLVLTVLSVTFAAGVAQAGPLLVAGSPEYDSTTGTGLKPPFAALTGPEYISVNNNGEAVGCVTQYINNISKGYRAVSWDSSGTAATELRVMGTDANSNTSAYAYMINDVGTIIGWATKYVDGVSKGYRAVRWDAGGMDATVLGDLGTDGSGFTHTYAYAINDVGTIIGNARKYVDGSNQGYCAVRWEATSTTATKLNNLGVDPDGQEFGSAQAINHNGIIVGWSDKYVNGNYYGSRAVRWNASSSTPTELGVLGTGSSGASMASAVAVNDAGTIVGRATKYVNGNYLGYRAVRWEASGTAATELGSLSTDGNGSTSGAYAINQSGTAVGYSEKIVSGVGLGTRAVRWDASGTNAIELSVLGTSTSGYTVSYAYDINDAGTVVGCSRKYLSGTNKGDRAVIWLPDASVKDLNDLGVVPVPAGGTWTLTNAKAISADGWVAGEGTFDPDGDGALASYGRLWVAQVGLGGTWTKPAGGTWGRGPNWSTGTPAMQVGDATFNLASSFTVTLDRDELTNSIAINAGSVAIDFAGHTLATESGLNVSNGATLKGAGTIVSDIVNAGTIAPGNSPGTLNITGNLTNAGTLDFEIASLLNYDQVDLTGAFTASGTIAVTLLDGYTPMAGDIFDIVDFGSFTNNGYTFDWRRAVLSAGLAWDTTTFATTGSIGVIAVPEPAAFTLLSISVASLLISCWRQRTRTA